MFALVLLNRGLINLLGFTELLVPGLEALKAFFGLLDIGLRISLKFFNLVLHRRKCLDYLVLVSRLQTDNEALADEFTDLDELL